MKIFVFTLVLIFNYSLLNSQILQEIKDSIFYYKNNNDYNKVVEFTNLFLDNVNKDSKNIDRNYEFVADTIQEIFYKAGMIITAKTLIQNYFEYCKENYDNDDSIFIYSLIKVSDFYYKINDFRQAGDYYKDALEKSRKLYQNNHPSLAVNIIRMAKFYEGIGNFNEAEKLFIESLEIKRRINNYDSQDLVESINDLANILVKREKLLEAEPLLNESLEMSHKLFINDHPILANSINNMANFYKCIGDYKKAISLYQEALDMRRRLFKTANPDLVQSIENMAEVVNNQGDKETAEVLFKEALEINKNMYKNDNPNTALSMCKLGEFYYELERIDEAENLFKTSFTMCYKMFKDDHPLLAQNFEDMARLNFTLDNYQGAEQLLIKALDMRRRLYKNYHPDLIQSINMLAMYYDIIGRFAYEERLLDESIKLLTIMISKNFNALSENERQQFWIKNNYYFELFYSFSLKRMNTNPLILTHMYNNLLFTKALLLNTTKKVRERILNSGDSVLISIFNEWIGKKEYLAKLYSLTKQEIEQRGENLDSLEQIANDLEKEISHKSEPFTKEYEKKSVNWQEVQLKLKNDEAAIEIVRFKNDVNDSTDTDKVYYAVLIVTKYTKYYPKLVLLKNGNELDSIYLNEYHSVIKLQGEGLISNEESDKTICELYNQYWKPIAEKLKGIKKIYLSVDGVYNQINLETLINLETKKFLYEEIELNILTSTRDLVTAKPIKPNKEKIAYLFGRPNYKLGEEQQMQLASALRTGERQLFSDKLRADLERTTATDLPGTETEVLNIKKIMNEKGWQAKVFTGDSALEEEVKAIDNPVVLHIATHGFFLSDVELERNVNEGFIKEKTFGMETFKAYENPLLRSGLLFAGSQRSLDGKEDSKSNIDNGILTAYEAMNLKLDNTELVVLSACQTGLGEVRNGEGVYGLQRAFIVAGAKTIIMSLWKVNDTTTQELMTSFYTKWLSGMTKREAFKDARNEIRAKYKYPYYWGAFVMVGE